MLYNQVTVDGFRFISTLHTTARQLSICTQIVRLLEKSQLPKALLFEMLIKWSCHEESNNEFYKNAKGKLTDNGKATTAIPHYLTLCEALGLINNINGFYSNSRISSVLLHFADRASLGNQLSNAERIFYSIMLFSVDADGLFLVFKSLFNNKAKNQIELQSELKDLLNERLIAKRTALDKNSHIQTLISEKYKTVNFIWKKAEKYGEHLMIPRCEWLASLGLVSIERVGSSTRYSLTSNGIIFFQSIPIVFGQSNIRDITNDWIDKFLMSMLDLAIFKGDSYKYSELPSNKQKVVLGSAVSSSFNVVKSSNSFRLPLYDCLIFIVLYCRLEHNVTINFFEIYSEMKNIYTFENRNYILKTAGRANEGYIAVSII